MTPRLPELDKLRQKGRRSSLKRGDTGMGSTDHMIWCTAHARSSTVFSPGGPVDPGRRLDQHQHFSFLCYPAATVSWRGDHRHQARSKPPRTFNTNRRSLWSHAVPSRFSHGRLHGSLRAPWIRQRCDPPCGGSIRANTYDQVTTTKVQKTARPPLWFP